MKRIYRLRETDNIKKKDIIQKILKEISLDDVKAAILRAEKIRQRKMDKDGKQVGETIVYANPDFSIHEFEKKVLKDSGDL